MQGLVAFLLFGPLLEARPLAPQPQLYHVLLLFIRGTLAANLNDALHVAALGPDQPACHLELLFVLNLDVKPARVFDVLILRVLLLRLRQFVAVSVLTRWPLVAVYVVVGELTQLRGPLRLLPVALAVLPLLVGLVVYSLLLLT